MFGKIDIGPRARRREQKQARILAAARKLLLSRGADGLSLREVARRAGCSPAGMYEFYESKAELLEALRCETSRALAASLSTAGRGTRDPAERLVAMGLGYVRFARRHPQDFLLLFGSAVPRRSLAQDVPADSPYGLIRAGVGAVADPARLRAIEPRLHEALSYGFWSAVHGMAMLQLTALAGFRADLGLASRAVLQSMVAGWSRMLEEK